MLRRKLLTRVGLLICAFVAGAVVAIYLLQGVLSETERVNADATLLIDNVQAVERAVTAIDAARARGDPRPQVAAATAQLRECMDRLATHPGLLDPSTPEGAAYARLAALIPRFLAAAGTSTAGDPGAAGPNLTIAAHEAAAELAGLLRRHIAAEQLSTARYFRVMVIGLTLAALVMVNVAILVLLRMAQVVLRPVAELVQGSRELAAERFEHRVRIDQADEFGELAHAYNRLAEQLQASEERKAEALRQLAVTLNHDLNNAMATIDLLSQLLTRRLGTAGDAAGHLAEIRAQTQRMARTIASLKNIRRVVLTDYAPGMKMIDLERSVDPQLVPEGEPPLGRVAAMPARDQAGRASEGAAAA